MAFLERCVEFIRQPPGLTPSAIGKLGTRSDNRRAGSAECSGMPIVVIQCQMTYSIEISAEDQDRHNERKPAKRDQCVDPQSAFFGCFVIIWDTDSNTHFIKL